MSLQKSITPSQAKKLIEQHGYKVNSIEAIEGSISHIIFRINKGEPHEAIVRFENTYIEDLKGRRKDFQYNSPLSLEREANLCELVRKEAELPAPEIKGLHYTEEGIGFLVVESLKGKHWRNFIKDNNYSLEKFLASLEYLGSDIAQAQRVRFNSYGNIMGRNWVEPEGVRNFIERVKTIIDLKIERVKSTEAFTQKEFNEVKKYFHDSLEELLKMPVPKDHKPVLILTDIHPMNFLVDEKGKPSGYFDLEFCQAGAPVLEIYTLNSQLFAYFDKDTFHKARNAFFKGFYNNGGVYEEGHPVNQRIEELLGLSGPLSGVACYYGKDHDPIRRTWSKSFKEILFDSITNKIDPLTAYILIADVLRIKTKQPKKPTLP
ncbi:MAG TPA: aminoglycoside phosphotransferase family protein [Candidatus Woesearchaeota archaeon]|nr:aminoglycoside phosphotransferase family protein [Candidatus Woesearchaeota archaeon]